MSALSRSGRIILLLVLNVIMFLAEIIVGYKTSSLALIADAFHMLSDVLSQIIALYAIRLAAKTKWQPTLSYGWQRAELLGALYNGVFLLALCFSILLDAIERFFSPEDMTDPQLVLIVGGIGLACNLLGLVLFHDHAGHGHSHGGHSHDHSHSHGEKKAIQDNEKVTDPTATPTSPTSSDLEKRPRRNSLRHNSSLERISPLKQANLQNLQQAALDVQQQIESEERHEKEELEEEQRSKDAERRDATVVLVDGGQDAHEHNKDHDHEHDHSHDQGYHDHEHDHDHGKKDGKKQPSGEDLNMRGIFLHVMGDALGSVGVIFTALFIWKTDLSWRFYMDPIVSILISAIIIHSALPLVRSASFILMQGVPVGVDIEEIRTEIKIIPDVLSIHDLHIWQLTSIKMVASLHVLVSNQEAFERVSKAVKTIMHRAGVHSTTIQPEFPGMHPYLSPNGGSPNGLRLRRVLSDEEAKTLLQSSDLSSRATSVGGAQSNEYLHEAFGGGGGHGGFVVSAHPGTGATAAAAGSDDVTPVGAVTDPNAAVVLMEGQEGVLADENNCAMLCLDGEQPCDVGSCCTVPVKR